MTKNNSTSITNQKNINKTAYCLLAFFLGGIGIHKFYAGKNTAGILFLLFSWTAIPLIISFIDFLIGLFKESDKYGNISL